MQDKLLTLEVLFMERKNDSPQKAAMREMMRDYLKKNGKRQTMRLLLK